MQPLKTLKPFEPTGPLKKQPSNSSTSLIRLQKNLRIFCFQNSLRLDNLQISATVQEVTL